ncbi:trypsin-like peptidase domain-containing protein [Patescibacteria group bacterium]|nr:trypsin-like peptidase domain-containing protein [Patescibacteria group bacterium]
MTKNRGIYELPKINFKKYLKNRLGWVAFFAISTSLLAGFTLGSFSNDYFSDLVNLVPSNSYTPQVSQEQAVINVVRQYSPAVVSIVISKDVPIMEEYFYNPLGDDSPFIIEIPGFRQNGTKKQEIGGGTGFIVSSDGMIVTNKHVVLDKKAEYSVFTNDGRKYPAKVLARDPIQDLAILKIEPISEEAFATVKLGDSSGVQIGQTVIAIGNALGEFRNTVSVGAISGLKRTVLASSNQGFTENLEDIIQTDAAINLGNSGGPLLNLKGEVIAVNTAVAESAQNIGFAIPINSLKRGIIQVQAGEDITYPFLGVRYVAITPTIKEEKKLSIDNGALIAKGDAGETAIIKGSAAEEAGFKSGDIIIEFGGEKITAQNSLALIIQKYNPKDQVQVKILRGEEEIELTVTLGERS